jgi:hypothetical protein
MTCRFRKIPTISHNLNLIVINLMLTLMKALKFSFILIRFFKYENLIDSAVSVNCFAPRSSEARSSSETVSKSRSALSKKRADARSPPVVVAASEIWS